MKRNKSIVLDAEEVIKSIAESLRMSEGFVIEAAARAAGLQVRYVGDSLFEQDE